jgi:hypothetical protein
VRRITRIELDPLGGETVKPPWFPADKFPKKQQSIEVGLFSHPNHINYHLVMTNSSPWKITI